jgi:hypothetical protein
MVLALRYAKILRGALGPEAVRLTAPRGTLMFAQFESGFNR